MLSIRLITPGREDYYINLSAEDYYLAGGEPPPIPCGEGARRLEISGKLDSKAFRSLFRGYHPTTGEPLVQNAGHSDRQSAWDLTFSAPKSVSIVWSVACVAIRLLIQKCQQQAVEAAIRYAEQNLVFSRAGKGGIKHVPVGVVVLACEHGTNRLLQPQLHTHVILMNCGVDDKNKSRALYTKRLFRYKKALGAYYRAYLAHLLETELGFSLIRKGDSFEIEGVPEDLIQFHAERRRQILAYLKKKGQSPYDAVAAAEAALKTRRTKTDIPPRIELFRRWREVSARRGFTEASLASLPRPKSRRPADDLQALLATAETNIAERHSHFAHKDFLFQALLEAPSRGISAETVALAVTNHLANGQNIVRLRKVDGERHYTTRAILDHESQLLKLAARLRHTPGRPVSDRILARILRRHPTLRSDQINALRYLTQGPNRLRIVSGKAGSGKTTLLRAARMAWEKQGFRVISATYTGKAARVLENATGIEAETIHRRLAHYKIRPGRVIKHHFKQYIRVFQGKRTYRFKKPQAMKVDHRTVVVVDEAGMVSSHYMKELMKRVTEGGGILVLVGDPIQLPPVDGTAPFQSLCRRAGFAELTQIQRQEDEWARLAVELFAQGKTAQALRLFADRNLITVRDDRTEALKALVLDWTAIGLTTPERATVLVSTNEESEAANLLCQQKRLEAGCLDPSLCVEIRDEDPFKRIAYVNHVYVGDRVLFTRNDRLHGVENGTVGTVIAIKKSVFRKLVAVKLDDGRRVIIPANKFPHIRMGYSSTTHKVQGETVKEAFVLAGGPNQNLPLSYVQASRAIHKTRFYTEKALLDEYLDDIDDSELARQMASAPDLHLASDLLPGADPALVSPPPAVSNASSNESRSRTASRKKTRPNRRKPLRNNGPDLTYGMAQVDAMLKRLGRLPPYRHPANPLESLVLPALPQAMRLSNEDALAVHYQEHDLAHADVDLDTSTNVPIALIIDAGQGNVALQANALQQQQQQEQWERLMLEMEIQQQRAAAQYAQSEHGSDFGYNTSYCDCAAASGSSSWPAWDSSCQIACAPAMPAFDQQAWLTAGAAQTQWTQNVHPSTTTAYVSANSY